MTIKKTLISTVAAGALAAMMAGCGSSSSSSSSSTTTDTTTSGVNPSSFEAVDGKILNGLATAYYVDENNVTQSITLDANKTYSDVVTGAKSKGSYAYTIPTDSNVTADMIRYVEINGTAAEVKDGKSYPGAFIDVDNSGDYNASIDEAFAATKSLSAPQGVEYVTPVSTMIMSLMGTDMTAAELNTTKLANKMAVIAAKLNLSVDDIKNVDPMTDGEYKVINGFLADAATPANLAALATAIEGIETNATSFGAVVSALATSATGNAKTLFAALKSQLDAGTVTVDDLDSINVDKTRDNGGVPVLDTKSDTAIGDISTITVDGEDVADLLSTGDKVKTGDVAITFASNTGDAADTNASGTVDMYISVANPESRVEETATSDKLVIKIAGVGIKKTESSTILDINDSIAKVSYEYYNVCTNTSIKGNYKNINNIDGNNTTVLGTWFTDGGSSSDTIKLGTLVSQLETNATSELNITERDDVLQTKIVDLKALVVDSDGLLQKVDSDGNQVLWSTTTVAGTGNAIAAEGKMILNLRADMRNMTTGENKAPSISKVGLFGTEATIGETIKLDYNESYAEAAAMDMNVTFTNNDSNESNTTVTIGSITGLPTGLLKLNSGTTATAGTAANNYVEYNVTVDTNITSADKNTTIYFTSKDEFGETNSSKDQNVSIFFNAEPVVKYNGTELPENANGHYQADINVTEINNSTITFAITNFMGESNTSIQANGDLNSTVTFATDVNGTSGEGNFTLTDLNASTQPSDFNVTIGDHNTSGGHTIYIDFNVSQ